MGIKHIKSKEKREYGEWSRVDMFYNFKLLQIIGGRRIKKKLNLIM